MTGPANPLATRRQLAKLGLAARPHLVEDVELDVGHAGADGPTGEVRWSWGEATPLFEPWESFENVVQVFKIGKIIEATFLCRGEDWRIGFSAYWSALNFSHFPRLSAVRRPAGKFTNLISACVMQLHLSKAQLLGLTQGGQQKLRQGKCSRKGGWFFVRGKVCFFFLAFPSSASSKTVWPAELWDKGYTTGTTKVVLCDISPWLIPFLVCSDNLSFRQSISSERKKQGIFVWWIPESRTDNIAMQGIIYIDEFGEALKFRMYFINSWHTRILISIHWKNPVQIADVNRMKPVCQT